MKTRLVLAVSLALAAASPAFAATGHEHHAPAAKSAHEHGQKWATDAPLRKGMGAIRADLAATLPAVRARTLTAADAKALGEKLEGQVGYIVTNCKLPPEADAGLHVIVAELVAAADALKTAGANEAPQAISRAVKATNDYASQFDHPRFKPLAMPAQAASRALPFGIEEAVLQARQQMPGEVVAAELDPAPRPHYHVNMRLPDGRLAKLEMDREGYLTGR